jgi:hypothetical protein
MDLKVIRFGDVGRIHLTEDWNQWQAHANIVIKFHKWQGISLPANQVLLFKGIHSVYLLKRK